MMGVRLFFLLVFTSYTNAMDVPIDSFSQQTNILRKLVIFPILASTKTITDARNLLCSIALVSKKSYEQINCPFFMRDVLQKLADKQKDPEAVVAYQLKMAGARRYNKMSERLYHLVTEDSDSERNDQRHIAYLLARGAWLRDRYGTTRTTLLMNAVKKCSAGLVKFLVCKGADVNVRLFDGSYARDCNVIYTSRELKKLIYPMIGRMWKLEDFNRKNPDKPIYVPICLSHMPETRILKNALAIDKILQDHQAQSLVKTSWHPLLTFIREFTLVRCLFVYLYGGDVEGIASLPDNVRECLEECDPFNLFKNVEY